MTEAQALERFGASFRRGIAIHQPVRKVMSDGDNLQVMAGSFVTNRGFWASPLRGRFNMTWEMPPILAEIAPRASCISTAGPAPVRSTMISWPAPAGAD